MRLPHARAQAVAHRLVRLATPLVPADLRDDWQREWEGELATLADRPHPRPIRRAAGAIVDAFWLRQRSVADFRWIDDLRYSLQQLRQHAAFACTAAGILALGLAATVTMFSVMDQVLLRPLPYPDPDRIVTLWQTRAPQTEPLEVAPGNFLDWRERARGFAFLAGVEPWALDVSAGSRPEVWFSAKVTDGFFETFGVRPLIGRFFSPDEFQAGRDHVLVIGERFWRQRFGADPSVIDQSFRTEDGVVTIVGVAPAEFEPRLLDTAGGYRDIWQPKVIQPYEPNSRGSGYWVVVGRLQAGVPLDTAQAEMDAVARQLAAEHPRTNATTGARILPLRDHFVGNVRLAAALLAGAVAMVLIIACVNVANLLLARGAAREREIAIRVALGARRGRIVQQLLTESLLIAVAGGLAGALLAQWALAGLARFGPRTVPWIETLHLDWRALAFTASISLAVALLSGILPAWRVARAGLSNAGRKTSTADAAQHRLRAGLVVVELALALVLITSAGLLLRSFAGLMGVDPGFQRERVLVAQVFAWDLNPTPADLRRFFDEAMARIESLPGVQHVGAVSAMPFIESNIDIQGPIVIGSRPPPPDDEAPRASLTVATPGYFDAMRIPLKAGRALDARDGPDTRRVAVISDELARRHWASFDEALDDTVRLRSAGGVVTEVEIVGVVGSVRHDSLDRQPREELFMPLAQRPFGSMTFVVRSASDASLLLEPVKTAIWDVNPAQTIYRAATLDELVQRTVAPRRFALGVIIAFAGVSLLLAIGGVYGVVSAITASRLREVAVRVALGAGWWDITRWVLARGLTMAGLGLAVGLAGSLGAAQLLRGFLFGIGPSDPLALVSAGAVMTLAAMAACYLPARRAAGADPIAVLHTE